MRDTVVCLICGKNFANLSSHLYYKHEGVKKYQEIYGKNTPIQSKHLQKTKEIISKKVKNHWSNGVYKENQSFRRGKTFEEIYSSEKAKRLHKAAGEKNIGENNPAKRKEVREKISKALKGKKLSKERREQMSKIQKQRFIDNPNLGKEIWEKCFKNNMKFKETKIEQIMFEILKKKGLDSVAQRNVYVEGYNVDFYLEPLI